jgi:hypothetical protein
MRLSHSAGGDEFAHPRRAAAAAFLRTGNSENIHFYLFYYILLHFITFYYILSSPEGKATWP